MAIYRFQWILDDIRNGLILPDRWPEDDETANEETDDNKEETGDNKEETSAKAAPVSPRKEGKNR